MTNTAPTAATVNVTTETREFTTKLVAYVSKKVDKEPKVEELTRCIEIRWPGCTVEVHRHIREEKESVWVRIDGAKSEEMSTQGNGDSAPKVYTVGKRAIELIRRQQERVAHHNARVASRKSVRARVKALLPATSHMPGDGYYEFGLPTKHGNIHLKAENSGRATVSINLHATLEPEDAARLMLALQAAIGTKDPTP